MGLWSGANCLKTLAKRSIASHNRDGVTRIGTGGANALAVRKPMTL